MANSVDLSAHAKVDFVFEQEYRAFNSDFTYVEVSLDGGTTWEQQTDANPNVPTNDGIGGTADTLKSLQFTVNNSTDVKFRFRWSSMEANAGYAWQVDDVAIYSLSDNDIEVTENFVRTDDGLRYYQIPEAQIAPINFTAKVYNKGANTQTGVALSADEAGSGFNSTSPAVTLNNGDTDSLVVAQQFTPPSQGTYDVDLTLLNDATDDIPANNAMSTYSFEVGQHVYARDNGTIDGRVDGTLYQNPVTVEPGTFYDMYQQADLTGIEIVLGPTMALGVEVFGKVYQINDQGDLDPIGETEPYITTAADTSGGAVITVVFDTPITLNAGEPYLVSARCPNTEFSVATGGLSIGSTSLTYGDLGAQTGWYIESRVPMVRMNFDPTVSTENNELSTMEVTQYPNPFANETTVNYSLQEAAEVNYQVVDMAGNVIVSGEEGNQSAGKHTFTIDGASFANGVYYLELTAGDNKVTRRLVVNK